VEVADALGRMLRASQRQQTAVSQVPGIEPEDARALAKAEIENLAQLLEHSEESLAAIPGIGEEKAAAILEAVEAYENPPEETEESEEESGPAETSEAPIEEKA